MLNSTIITKLLLFLKRVMLVLGILAMTLWVLSFTDVPYYAYRNLSLEEDTLTVEPEIIVLLGGSGMPSPDGLIRSYCAAQYALQFKLARIIIALPYNEGDSLQQLRLMQKELTLRGIDSIRISYEPLGHNTRSQAINIASQVGNDKLNSAVLIVSSPEHIYRAVKTFRKAGFLNVGAAPAFDTPVEKNKIEDKENGKDLRVKNLALRYNMWSYLNYELITIREYCAIFYYKLKGWI